ncbi:MAG: ATP-binding protein, partial [Gemmatimonadaceae bacterium]
MTVTSTSAEAPDLSSTDSARLGELRDLLQSVATGSGLHVALDRIARWIERASPDAICSILLLDEREGRLRHGAAPSLPEEYTKQIDGVTIGPMTGSCGTAAYYAKPVVVDDIATDPLWANYKELALGFGLRACWSHPIIGARGNVIGTFACYSRQPLRPRDDQWSLVVDAAQLASLVIDRAQADTARLQQEREMSSVLAHATDQIVRLDKDGRVTFVNNSALRASRRPSNQRALREAIARAAAGEANDGEIIWRGLDGNIRLGSYSLKPIPGPDGSVSQLLLEGSDITDKRELERRLRQSEKMESLGRLAGGIAHDFNNVLAAIHGYGELLSADLPPDTEMADNVNGLLRASRRARDLVRQILAFSRKSDVEHLSIDLRAVVADAGGLLRAGLPATVELIENLPLRPVTILGDASRISQVLLNLGSNAEYAMRATGDGRIEISLEVLELDTTRAHSLGMPPGKHARLRVRDNGGGVPDSVLSKIFEPFFTTKPIGEGTGMGLAVVHGIVTAHGGTVHVESNAGIGTSFDVYLPCVHLPARTATPITAMPAHGSGHILVVDDEAAIVSMLKRLLPRRGYTATCLTSPIEALALFREAPSTFDVVITDRTMPRMTGDALIVQLHAIRPDLPIVICSGQGHMNNQGAGDDSSALVQHVSKPFELADLLRA